MKCLFATFFALAISQAAYGFGQPKHSKVEINAAPSGDKMALTFKIVATEGHAVTFDAPWKLDIKKHDGLTFGKATFSKADMDEKLPGWSLTSSTQPAQAAGDIEYQLVSFICTADKTQCYREVHKGTYGWKK